MSYISIYDSEGYILSQIFLDDEADPPRLPTDPDIAAQIPVGGGYVEGDFDPNHYVVISGVAEPRPDLVTDEDGMFIILNDGIEAVTIPLPDGTWISDHDSGDRIFVEFAEDFIFKSEIKGEFEFSLEPPFPYKPVSFKVIADAYNP